MQKHKNVRTYNMGVYICSFSFLTLSYFIFLKKKVAREKLFKFVFILLQLFTWN